MDIEEELLPRVAVNVQRKIVLTNALLPNPIGVMVSMPVPLDEETRLVIDLRPDLRKALTSTDPNAGSARRIIVDSETGDVKMIRYPMGQEPPDFYGRVAVFDVVEKEG